MLSSELIKLIDNKAGGIVSLQAAWINAVTKAMDSGIEEATVSYVIGVFEAPASLNKLCQSIGLSAKAEGSSFFGLLEQNAANSDYSPEEWLRALERMLQFLIRENRSSPIGVSLGYLSCSADYLSATEGLLGFADGVESFLLEFGFDG